MRSIDLIAIHCSATPPSMNIGAAEIRRWHVEERGWSDIGYHRVITRDGVVEPGRPVEKAGAHIAGHNIRSIGICIIGGINQDGKPDCNFTAAQWACLERVVREFKTLYPDAVVDGHRTFDAGKACPTFDVPAWWSSVAP